MYYNNILNDILKIFNNNIIFNDDDMQELKNNIYFSIKDYIKNNISEIVNYNFNSNLIASIKNIYFIQLNEIYHIDNYILNYKIEILVKECLKVIFIKYMPPRSYKYSFLRNINIDKNLIKEKILIIQNTPQPEQRTDEWYKFRHNLITASSIWKTLKSQSTINQIIYEKCKPYTIPNMNVIDSPLHWGHKYEPVSVNFYEYLYHTKIGDYGCIKHPKYYYIGASPDGINIDENNKRYGRMLEIKNIVNRKINGIPKMEYWIQMQVQMETCNLNECDFLETQFKEYINYNDFINDGNFNYTKDNKLKGIIVAFTYQGNIYYEYAPILLKYEDYDDWEKKILHKNREKEWVQNIYWKLEKFSNVLVLRNKLWFNSILEEVRNIWNIIEYERINGYEHRAPNKRSKVNTITNENKCLINI